MKTPLLICLTITVAIGFLMPASAQTQQYTILKPFTQQTNYMSLRGYLRWKEFLRTMSWPETVVTYDAGSLGGDISSGKAAGLFMLAQSVTDNPFAFQHIGMWSTEHTGLDYNYRVFWRYIYNSTEETLFLEGRGSTSLPWKWNKSGLDKPKRNVSRSQIASMGEKNNLIFKFVKVK